MAPKRESGRYVLQPQGYKAFTPEPLPPVPPVEQSNALQTALSKADRALGRLDGSIETLPHPELFLAMFVRREAVLSSQIEGTQASLSDVIKAEADLARQGVPSDVDEVQNYMRAMQEGVTLLDKIPISTRLIKTLHRLLMNGVRGQHQNPGEIRDSQNWIGPAGCNLSNALFVPPPPHAVDAHLSDLEKFIHDESPLPPLLRAGMIHAQFETIHPFLDGNGRVGRLLITLFLVEKTLLRRPVLYLSYYFKQNRGEYYKRLQAIRDKGAWEEWLLFFLEGVAVVSNLAAATAANVLRLRERDRQKVIEKFDRAASTPLKVLDGLYELPLAVPTVIAERYGISYPTANTILTGMEEVRIVTEVTGKKRNRQFLYLDYMMQFDEIRA